MVCGDQCVDVTVNGRHCGRCLADCPGACVDGVCSCRPLGMANRVVNGGFDADASGWTAVPADQVALTWQARDAAGACPGPQGSMVIRDRAAAGPGAAVVSQCVSVPPLDPTFNQTWRAGLNFYFASPVGGTASLRLTWYSAAGCSASKLLREDPPLPFNSPGPDRWGLLSEDVVPVTPPEARAAKVDIVLDKQVSGGALEIWIDRVHVTTDAGF
jgi:hypothetical protein